MRTVTVHFRNRNTVRKASEVDSGEETTLVVKGVRDYSGTDNLWLVLRQATGEVTVSAGDILYYEAVNEA